MERPIVTAKSKYIIINQLGKGTKTYKVQDILSKVTIILLFKRIININPNRKLM